MVPCHVDVLPRLSRNVTIFGRARVTQVVRPCSSHLAQSAAILTVDDDVLRQVFAGSGLDLTGVHVSCGRQAGITAARHSGAHVDQPGHSRQPAEVSKVAKRPQ